MVSIRKIDDNPFTEHIDTEKSEAIEEIKELINAHPLAFLSFNWERMKDGVIQISLNFMDISCVIVIVTDEKELIEWFKGRINKDEAVTKQVKQSLLF